MNVLGVATLADMVSRKAEFLESPGCDPDLETIHAMSGQDYDVEDEVLLDTWFDLLVQRLGAMEEMVVHRHMTVDAFDAYVEGLDAGTATLGSHWSLSEETAGVLETQGAVEIMIVGRVDPGQVDWFTTLQQNFSHPHEEEVAFDGDVRVETIVEVATGRTWTSSLASYPQQSDVHPFVYDRDKSRLTP